MTRFRPELAGTVFAALLCASTMSAPASANSGDDDTAPRGNGLELRIRLAVDPVDPPPEYDPCLGAASLIAYTGERVRWCYRIINNSSLTPTRHDLESVAFGDVITDFPFTLVPGDDPYLTQVADVTESMLEEAVWTAYNPGPTNVLTATAGARLTVRPGISLVVTLGVDPIGPPPDDYCGTQTVATVPPGRTIRWCFRMTNHSSITRTRHTLRTTQNGNVLTDFPYSVETGDDPFITVTQVMGQTSLRETGTWTAYRNGPSYSSTATASARAIPGFGIFADGFE